MKCFNDPTRYYKGDEPSPKGLGYCAHCEKIGYEMNGLDGRVWKVVKTKNGVKRWGSPKGFFTTLTDQLRPFKTLRENGYDKNWKSYEYWGKNYMTTVRVEKNTDAHVGQGKKLSEKAREEELEFLDQKIRGESDPYRKEAFIAIYEKLRGGNISLN